MRILYILIIVQNIIYSYGLIKQHLNGAWIANDENEDYNQLIAIVPGGIYSDLMNNNIIEDVFYGSNDINSRWVAKRNWTYFRTFTVLGDGIAHENINIVFDGLDTFSTIYINNEKIGTTNNMFVQYIFDIKKYLRIGENNVTVVFESPIVKAQKLYNEQSKNYIVPPKCVPDEYNGECHVNHIRKMQASFAWDWGPALPSVGIWKNVSLEFFNSTVIRYVNVKTIPNDTTDSWDIYLTTYFADSNELKGSLEVKLFTDIDSILNIYNVNLTKNNDGEYIDRQIFSVPKLQVKLWWPNGYGNATLYTLKVIFVNENGNEQDVKHIRIGFRTVYLDQHEYYSGRAFYFIVNDVPIFAKGSNIIPINILPERGQNSTTIRNLLQSAKDVHMNMLRVWGGGTYESDEFYNVADELGIMIWQDFMFACSMYPTDENFLRTVEEEVKHQIRRLQYHASIILWAGNNENEAALRQNWYGTGNNFSLYKDDFIKLYVNTIKPIVLQNDYSRQFIISSPTNGIQSEESGYIADNPQNPLYGDVHFYNYIQDSWDSNIYPIPRFASEYGYQSLPKLSVLLKITDNITSLQIDGEFMNHRQHHILGYIEMHLMTNMRLKLPEINDSLKYMKTFIYYSQIMQAMAVKIETEHYRLWRSSIDDEGRGFTSGALYWQLNDVWVAPTWAGIDYENNWKMLHYFAKDFFDPIIIAGNLKRDRELEIYLVNDKLLNYYNATVALTIYKWNSFTPISSKNITVPIVFNGHSMKVTSFWIDTYLSDANCGDLTTAKLNCFLYLSISDVNNQPLGPDNFIFPSPLKAVALNSPNITISSVEQTEEKTHFNIEIKTDMISLFVWLDSGDIRGRFSKNGFLQTKEIETIYFTSESFVETTALKEALTITNLMDEAYI